MTMPERRTLRTMDPPHDAVRAVRSGDPQALATWYRAHAPAMLLLAQRLTGSADDAEDAVHDVFVGLPEALARYEERGQLRAWLLRLTARVVLMQQRRARRRDEGGDPDRHSTSVPPEADPPMRQRIHAALRSLSPSLRHVFVLRVLYDYPHADIAALLGISVNASEVRLHRAVQQLRRTLEDLA